MIAGPNGSGKSTLTDDLRKNYPLNFGFYINADDIEKTLKQNGKFGFRRFNLSVTLADFTSFFESHPLHNKCGVIKFESSAIHSTCLHLFLISLTSPQCLQIFADIS